MRNLDRILDKESGIEGIDDDEDDQPLSFGLSAAQYPEKKPDSVVRTQPDSVVSTP